MEKGTHSPCSKLHAFKFIFMALMKWSKLRTLIMMYSSSKCYSWWGSKTQQRRAHLN
jgi:hypothetical protein